MNEFSLPTREEAMRQLFQKWSLTPQVEQVPVAEAAGRVPAEDVFAVHTLPVVRASSGDGIAVKSAQFANGLPDASQWQEGIDYVRADTGDDFDDQFDAVIYIEEVTFLPNGGLSFDSGVSVQKNSNVKLRGKTVEQGELLVQKGLPLRPIDLAILVTGGITHVTVYKKPIVAFLPTGSELIPAGNVPQRGQMVDANSILVHETLLEMQAIPLCYPIVKDAPSELEAALRKALSEADVVIINGGSSKGAEDYNTRLLSSCGELICHGVLAAPGRPMGIGIIDGKPVINLPGPTAAAFYGLDWCIRKIVNRFFDLPMPCPRTIAGTLTADLALPTVMEFLGKVHVHREADGTVAIDPLPMQSTRPVTGLRANGMFVSQIDGPSYRKGDTISVTLLRGEELI